VARTLIEATLYATMASLGVSRALLESCAWAIVGQGEERKASSTTSFASSTLPLLVPGQVLE
jgi:hypothetical protein